MNNKFWRVGKQEYVTIFQLLSRRLPKWNDESHETPQLRLPVSWSRIELVLYRGKITSVSASASLVRESYMYRTGRYTTLDLPKLTALRDACKLASCLMISVFSLQSSVRHLQVSKRMGNYKYTGISICRSTSHHHKNPYEQKGTDCLTLEDGTDKLFRSSGNRLPINVT
jgi:hypothetical protein